MNMEMNQEIILDESIRSEIEYKLNIGGIDPETLQEAAEYFYKTAKMLDNIQKSLYIWTGGGESPLETGKFITGMLGMLTLMQKNMDKTDGIAGMYISRIDMDRCIISDNHQAWCYKDFTDRYAPLRGVYFQLIKAGLNQDFIDKYYLDGTLLELYEACWEVIPAVYNLAHTQNPNPLEVREGIFIIEGQLRQIYNKLYIEEFEDARGLTGVMIKAFKILEGVAADK